MTGGDCITTHSPCGAQMPAEPIAAGGLQLTSEISLVILQSIVISTLAATNQLLKTLCRRCEEVNTVIAQTGAWGFSGSCGNPEIKPNPRGAAAEEQVHLHVL